MNFDSINIWQGILRFLKRLPSVLRYGWKLLVLLVLTQLSLYSTPAPQQGYDRVYGYTLPYEFDYISWMADAALRKLDVFSVQPHNYLGDEQQHDLVIGYIADVGRLRSAESQLEILISQPEGEVNPLEEPALREQIAELEDTLVWKGALAEAILQDQVSTIAAEMGLTFSGQPVPPLLFRTTPLPFALIISPRDHIEQVLNVSLRPEVTLDTRIELEEMIFADLEYSALVVPIGGVGVYPTMVAQTTNLNWLAEVIAHEWTHNYLTLRPLGMNYMTNAELRTINETVASISGTEIGQAVIARYYPELAPVVVEPSPEPEEKEEPTRQEEPQEPVFSFNQEMYETRNTVDELLKQGRIEEAEEYMEMRRQFFWENGYRLRKINQAYFAFYGAYADSPGGAAGEDPVGEAVRNLRANSSSLEEFINRIAWVTSFDQLLEILADSP